MAKIVKKCSKCGKRIHVVSSEFCCPLCGEFFTDIQSNEQVYINSENTYVDKLVEDAKAKSKAFDDLC